MKSPVVQSLHHSDTGTWSHLVADPDSAAAVIIDPVLDFDAKSGRTGTTFAQGLLDLAVGGGYRVGWILETHAHADHLSAATWLKQKLAARTGIGAGIREVQRIFKPIFNLEDDFATDGSQFDHLFADGERFSLGSLDCEVIATPGHTSDSVSYRIGDALFVGDSLFMPDGGTARCDFPGAAAATLYASIQRLYRLPDDTRVFVCHDYCPGGRPVAGETTIGAEKAGNIHLRASVSEAEFVTLRETRDATLAMPALIIPAVQVNIRAGELPTAEDNGVRYLKIPLDKL
jgi:glyoxylase-like metal-dependent hydrolase (beta-lactamase superfamily II)